MYQPFGQHPLHPVSAVSETSTTWHLILKIRTTDLPLTAVYISAYSLLGSITRHPQCLIAECQQILLVRCCSDSCNHYRNMHRFDTLKSSKPARTFSSILVVFICAVEVGQVTDFYWSWCLYEHCGRNTPSTDRPAMTNWFHHLLTGNVAL